MTTDNPTPSTTSSKTENTTSTNGAAHRAHAGTDSAARIAHDFIDRVAGIAQQSEERIRQAGETAEESLKQSLDIARNKSATVQASVTGFVQQHPLAALGIAFGAGVLLSYLTKGSRATYDDSTD